MEVWTGYHDGRAAIAKKKGEGVLVGTSIHSHHGESYSHPKRMIPLPAYLFNEEE